MSEPAKLTLSDILDFGQQWSPVYPNLCKHEPPPKAGGRERFLNLVTLQEATFIRTLVAATGRLYWQQEGTEGLLTESQMTVARWHSRARYSTREALLRASVKWTMKAARRVAGEDRSALVQSARARHRELVMALKRKAAS